MIHNVSALSISDLGYLITLFVMNVSFEKDDTFTKNQFLEGRPQGEAEIVLQNVFLLIFYQYVS